MGKGVACADGGSLQGFHCAVQILLGGCEERPGLQTWGWLRVRLSFGMLDDRGAASRVTCIPTARHSHDNPARQADRLGPACGRRGGSAAVKCSQVMLTRGSCAQHCVRTGTLRIVGICIPCAVR